MPKTDGAPAVSSGGGIWRKFFEILSCRPDLAGMLALLADELEIAWPGARVALHILRQGQLLGKPSSAGSFRLLVEVEGLYTDPGPLQAPWWQLRGRSVSLSHSAAWARYLPAAARDSLRVCWSDRLIAPHGEVVGTLSLFLPDEAMAACLDLPALQAVAGLAALAIEQYNLLEELNFQATHDPVTGLCIRQNFDRQIQPLTLALPPPMTSAVLVAELDGFSRICEILGDTTGDLLLFEAATRLKSILRPSDTATRSRTGQLVAMLPALPNQEAADEMARQIIEVMAAPFAVGGHELRTQARIGLCHVPQHGREFETLLRNARVALNQTGHAGSERCLTYCPDMARLSPDRLWLEQRLRAALEHGEFLLNYQPQVRVPDGLLVGVEALVRWAQPELGFVSPGVFIPIAEETGLIIEIGHWVMLEACRQARVWELVGRPCRVAVNVSALQFSEAGFAGKVQDILGECGLDPHLLELELTESVIMRDPTMGLSHIRWLRERGVAFALDDFGTGHSSLSYLRDLPMQRLKVDRSFLREIEEDVQAPLLSSIVTMAHRMGLEVIVEGVETSVQWEVVRRLGCEEVQGYLFGRPMTAGGFEEWVRRHREVA